MDFKYYKFNISIMSREILTKKNHFGNFFKKIDKSVTFRIFSLYGPKPV